MSRCCEASNRDVRCAVLSGQVFNEHLALRIDNRERIEGVNLFGAQVIRKGDRRHLDAFDDDRGLIATRPSLPVILPEARACVRRWRGSQCHNGPQQCRVGAFPDSPGTSHFYQFPLLVWSRRYSPGNLTVVGAGRRDIGRDESVDGRRHARPLLLAPIAYAVYSRSDIPSMQWGFEVSIKHSLLVLLAEGDRYGYELRQEFEGRTGGVWPLNVGQVYTTLERLERDGLVTREESDSGRQVRYRLADAGRAEVQQWWSSPVPFTTSTSGRSGNCRTTSSNICPSRRYRNPAA